MVTDPGVLLAFLPAALALNLTPGADMMFVLAQGLKGGARAGLAANLGIALGCFVHVLIAGLGLAALLATLPGAFELIRWGGVAYLLWLAYKSFRADGAALAPGLAGGAADTRRTPLLQVFREALVVNLLNPKVALFILAFLPQFVNNARPVLPQFLLLGLIICLGGLLVNGAVALCAGQIGQSLSRRPGFAVLMNRLSGLVFAGLALRLAVLERK